jgi:hypothetical protein
VEGEGLPAQGLGRKALPPRRRWMTGTPRQAPLNKEMVPVRTHWLWPQTIGRALGELGQASDSGDRGLLGFGGPPLQWPVVDHLGTERCQRSSCACQGEQPRAPRRTLGRSSYTEGVRMAKEGGGFLCVSATHRGPGTRVVREDGAAHDCKKAAAQRLSSVPSMFDSLEGQVLYTTGWR